MDRDRFCRLIALFIVLHAVLLADACAQVETEGGKDSGKKHTDRPAQPGIGGNGCHKRSSNGSGIRLELIA
jgi:hypothetical protein